MQLGRFEQARIMARPADWRAERHGSSQNRERLQLGRLTYIKPRRPSSAIVQSISVVPFQSSQAAPADAGTESLSPAAEAALPDEATIRDLDMRAPRYTSYPTADRFVEAYDARAHASWLGKRQLTAKAALSIYVHIPFCAQLCYYCACNKIITKDHGKAGIYLDYLERELDMVAGHLAGDRRVSQIRWGGGAPTFLNAGEMERLMQMFCARGTLSPGRDYSI